MTLGGWIRTSAPVQVPQIHVINAELLQGPLDSFRNVVRIAVDRTLLVTFPVAAQTELRSQEYLVSLSCALEPTYAIWYRNRAIRSNR